MIVADTHALLWWSLAPHELSARARQALDRETVGIAAVSCFEIARLVERGRIQLERETRNWLENVFALPQMVLLPLTIDVAVTAAQLPNPIRDPIDRIIVATAIHHRAPLVTKDHKILAANVVQTIW